MGVTTQTIRNWIKDSKLEGWKDPAGRWQVDVASLDNCKARGLSGDVIARKFDQLSTDVAALLEADRASSRLLEAVERERDRYRADAASVREAALQVVAAADETHRAVVALLETMARQRNALSQLLAPGSPQDLMPMPGHRPKPT